MQTFAQTSLFGPEPEPEYIIGIDESGTGAWAGPFHVAGVLAPVGWTVDGVGDSKKLTDQRRRELAPLIESTAVAHVAEVPVSAIDRGHRLSWCSAVEEVLGALECQVPQGATYRVIIDGSRDRALARRLGMDEVSRPLGVEFVPKADRDIQHVGAASILAKTARNDAMLRLHEEHPVYGWNENYGYITDQHVKAVREHGTCVHHRRIDDSKLRGKIEGTMVALEAVNRAVSASGAILVDRYRYVLWRRWEPAKGAVLFLMLNPSVANATDDDPTIRKCIGFAKRWGYGEVRVANLYALISTDPKGLRATLDVIGPDNDAHLRGELRKADLVVCAWGGSGRQHVRDFQVRVDQVMQVLRESLVKPMCLGTTKGGDPRHPLMLAYATKTEQFDA